MACVGRRNGKDTHLPKVPRVRTLPDLGTQESTKGPEMTTDNPDPLEVWRAAQSMRSFAMAHNTVSEGEADQAAAAIIAQHYAPVIAREADLEALVGELGEALRPFAQAGEKGAAVYAGVKALLAEKPHLSTYSTAYIDAARSTASAQLSWNDYEVARATLAKLEKDRG